MSDLTERHQAEEEQQRERQPAERIKQALVEILKEPEMGGLVRDRLAVVAGN